MIRGKAISHLITGLAFALLLGIGGASQAFAEDPLASITLSPVDKHYTVKPGETITDNYVILNDGQMPYDFLTYAAPYSVQDKTYDPNYDDTAAPRADVYKWVAFTQGKWHAGPRERVVVPFTIRVPENASPGGHYGVLFSETQPIDNNGSIVRKRRVGCVVYITVEGNNTVKGELKDIAIDWYQPNAPLTSKIEIQNTGNSDFPVTTRLVVKDLFGNTKYTHDEERYVLPETTRTIDLAWDSSPWFGLFTSTVSVTMLGKTETKSQLTLVAPYWLFLLVGLGILLGAIDVVRRKQSTASRRHR